MKRENLRKNFIKKYGEEAARGKQAHHLIPVKILKEIHHCREEDLPEEYNQTWNCLMLPTDQSAEFVHWGSHPWYTKFVRDQIRRVGEGNITSDTLVTVAMIIRTFCEENMEPFMDMKLNGRINDIGAYVEIVEFVYDVRQ